MGKSDKAAAAATKGCFFLVRHGIAEDDHPGGDGARALTAEGRRAFRELAEELAPELSLVGIATSPLVRAVQTAEILAEACGLDEVRSEGSLAADVASPSSITALVRKLGPGWAFVGHNPSLGMTLASWLRLDPDTVHFRKGAVAVISPGESGGSGSSLTGSSLLFLAAPGKKRLKSF